MIRTGMLALAVIAATACRDRAAPRAAAPPARIEVRVDAPGMAAMDVEATVVRPLEHALQGVPGARHVTADAREGLARVVVEVDGSLDAAAAAVRDRVAGAAATLPAEVGAPGIHAPPEGPRVHVGVTGDDVDPALLAAAAARLARALERTPGVAGVEVCAPREVAIVEVDPHRLRALGVPARDVERAIVGTNQARPAGDEPFDALRELVIPTLDGAPVRLGDVALIRIEHDPRGCVARAGRTPAASLAIAVRDPASLPAVAEAVDAAARDLPPGLRVRRFAHTLVVRTVAATREDAAALAGRLLDGDGIVEVGIAPAPCAGAGTFVRVHADREPSPDAVAVPGIATVARPGDPTVARWWLAGDDLDELHRLALEHAARIDGADGLTAAALVDEPGPDVQVEVDRARLAELGASLIDVADQLRLALDELDVGELVTDRGAIPVRLRLGARDRDQRLGELAVTAADGQAIPLDAVATIREAPSPRAICRRDGARAVAIDVRGDAAAARRIVEAELPAGYRWIGP